MTKTLTLEEHAALVRLVRETFPHPSRVLGDVDISTDHVHEAFAAAMVRVRELEAERDEARLTALEDAAVLMEADASTAPRSRSRVLMEAAERIRRAVVTDGGSALVDHAESVSARVAEWPEWKRREIRHFAIDRERGKNGGGL